MLSKHLITLDNVFFPKSCKSFTYRWALRVVNQNKFAKTVFCWRDWSNSVHKYDGRLWDECARNRVAVSLIYQQNLLQYFPPCKNVSKCFLSRNTALLEIITLISTIFFICKTKQILKIVHGYSKFLELQYMWWRHFFV